MDKKLLQDQITGLREKIKSLRNDKDLFIKVQGLQESEEKMRGEAKELREKTAFLKTSNKKLQEKKNGIVSSSIKSLANNITSLLPEGTAVIEVSESGDFFIGWQRNQETVVPYSGLSGGEKVTFDAALASALKANLIICEFAELDSKRLTIALEKIAKTDFQVVALSAHDPEKVPEGWEVVRL